MKYLKLIFSAYINANLMMRIVLGLVIGASLALLVPNMTIMTIIGKLFIGALKAIAPILVALLVTSAIAKSREGLGKRFRGAASALCCHDPGKGPTGDDICFPESCFRFAGHCPAAGF